MYAESEKQSIHVSIVAAVVVAAADSLYNIVSNKLFRDYRRNYYFILVGIAEDFFVSCAVVDTV